MKKSLRQMLLIGMSATMLAGVASPMVLAQEDTTEDTEQVEETETEEEAMDEAATDEEMTEGEETTEEEAEVEGSEAQQAIEEAVDIFQAEYPDSEIEEVDAELNQEEVIYYVVVRGFDAEDNTYELELEWSGGEVANQEFHEGWFNTEDTEDTDVAEDTEDGEPVLETGIEEVDDPDAALEEMTEMPETEEAADEAETEAPAESEELDEDQEFRALDFENLVTVDEATDAALQAVGAGEVVRWNLSADTAEWWGLFGDEENENPVWTLEIQNDEAVTNEEVRVDAVTGEVLNPEDVEETTEEMADDAEMTEETDVEDPEMDEAETTEDSE